MEQRDVGRCKPVQDAHRTHPCKRDSKANDAATDKADGRQQECPLQTLKKKEQFRRAKFIHLVHSLVGIVKKSPSKDSKDCHHQPRNKQIKAGDREVDFETTESGGLNTLGKVREFVRGN